MVLALLAGTKTQTRRPVKGLSKRFPLTQLVSPARHDDPMAWGWKNAEDGADAPLGAWPEWCPYGKPGDRLWVRETWAYLDFPKRHVAYRADGDLKVISWSPSIHMFRKDSRITLEVVSVRVERLQDITDEDAQAEGIEWNPKLDPSGPCKWRLYGKPNTGTNSPIGSYESLWDSINGAGSWDANPWVWCVTFRRIP